MSQIGDHHGPASDPSRAPLLLHHVCLPDGGYLALVLAAYTLGVTGAVAGRTSCGMIDFDFLNLLLTTNLATTVPLAAHTLFNHHYVSTMTLERG
jgi:hypothetical protein